MTTISEEQHAKSRNEIKAKIRHARYTTDDALAALCVFEWVLGQNEHNADIAQLSLNMGWSAMRSICLQAGLIVEQVWKHACGDEAEPEHFDTYDWEFVPALCRVLDWHELANNNQFGDQQWRPDPKEIWATMVASKAMKVA